MLVASLATIRSANCSGVTAYSTATHRQQPGQLVSSNGPAARRPRLDHAVNGHGVQPGPVPLCSRGAHTRPCRLPRVIRAALRQIRPTADCSSVIKAAHGAFSAARPARVVRCAPGTTALHPTPPAGTGLCASTPVIASSLPPMPRDCPRHELTCLESIDLHTRTGPSGVTQIAGWYLQPARAPRCTAGGRSPPGLQT